MFWAISLILNVIRSQIEIKRISCEIRMGDSLESHTGLSEIVSSK